MRNHEKVFGICENKCFVDLFNVIYPVGSIYMSVNDTDPAQLFGGTWERFAEGRTLIGVGTGSDVFSREESFEVEEEGGAYYVPLEPEHIPKHHHSLTMLVTNSTEQTTSTAPQTQRLGTGKEENFNTSWYGGTSTGATKAHFNIQPYMTCYIWKRTA